MTKRFAHENFSEDIQRQADQMNLDEAAIPPYTVPGPRSVSGSDFLLKERPELLKEFAENIYGEIPPRCQELDFQTVAEDPDAFDGLATRREIVIRCAQNGKARFLNMLLYIPNRREGKVPVFFGMNFRGNHAGTRDQGVRYTISKRYPTLDNSPRKCDNRASETERPMPPEEKRWCHEKVLARGYAVATICYWDVYPDHPYGFNDSILPLFFDEKTFLSEERPCGAISAWAWGYQRAVDCLETQPELDSSRICIHGLSRLGKTALWAGANDPRIALTVSCCSGTLGAKLSHRYMGEDFNWIQLWNPHWVVPTFRKYVNHDREIPLDQNQLIGCIAPRLVYIMSASEDEYADPKGEFLCGVEASPFYKLFGAEGMGGTEFPPVDTPLSGEIGYICCFGGHDFHPVGWDALLDFADHHWKK